MEYFAGLDVSMDETAICVIDTEGKFVLETKVETDPDAIVTALGPYADRLRRVGHEAGSLSPWLQVELQQRGLPAVCLEAYHARAALSAMRNKTDRTDAQGIAHILRTGWFKQVHVKSEESYRLRLLLTHRRNLKRKFLDIESAIRHSIKTFGLKLGAVRRGQFEARVRELTAHDALIAGIADCMLRARAALWQEYLRLHKLVVKAVSKDDVCRRFLGIPGIGPISALAFKTSIDVSGRISKADDGEVRHPLYEAANIMLTRFKGFSSLKAWGLKIAKKRDHKRACVAVARKLSVIMHAMWRDGSTFQFKAPAAREKQRTKRAPRRLAGPA